MRLIPLYTLFSHFHVVLTQMDEYIFGSSEVYLYVYAETAEDNTRSVI